jgi:hypothetical protein
MKIVSDVAYTDQRSSLLPSLGSHLGEADPLHQGNAQQTSKRAAESQLDPLKRDLPNLQPEDEQRLEA